MFDIVKRNFVILAFATLVCAPHSYSQEFSKAIEDNSFFIEEAFNQEDGVIQHISNGYFQSGKKDYVFTFTEEWPLGSQTHQVSITIPYQSIDAGSNGFGDVFINYRHQMWDESNWCWISPRLSIILPTGKSLQELGNGVVGIQANLPMSKRWTDSFISHVNIGATILPNVEGLLADGDVVRKTLSSFFAGASGIVLFTENFNFMFEILWSSNAELDILGNVARSSEILLSPGFRYAINIGDLQVVPGIAVPFTFASEQFDMNAFGYISFEHPF